MEMFDRWQLYLSATLVLLAGVVFMVVRASH